MVYNVLLVEDEDMVREAIASIIPWEELGYCLVGQAANGQEATKLLEKHKIHLVLTDICMPYMDGLDLAKHINENHPDIKVVIISGYDDFEYAKKAVTHKVSKYILKPLTSEELRRELTEIYDELEKAYKHRHYLLRLEKDYEQSQSLYKEKFLNQLLEERLSDEHIMEQMNQLDLTFKGSGFGVALLQITNVDTVKGLFNYHHGLGDFAAQNIISEILAEYRQELTIHMHQYKPYTYCFIYSKEQYRTEEKVLYHLQRILETITDNLKEYIEAQCCGGVGPMKDSLRALHQSYTEANKALEYSTFIKEESLVYYGDLGCGKQMPVGDDQYYKTILHGLLSQNSDHLKENIQAYLKSLQQTYDLFHIRTRIIHLIVLITQDLENYIKENENVMDLIIQFMGSIHGYKSMEAIESGLLDLFYEIENNLLKKQLSEQQKVAEQMKTIVTQRYHEETLSLSAISSELFLSSAYLGKVFKQVTGGNFKSYVIQIRMEKAKELLINSSLKTYDIAGRVGFKDPHYFSCSFKKYSGKSPKTFREQGA